MAESERKDVEPSFTEHDILDSSVAEKVTEETNVTEILAKYDKESVFRTITGKWNTVIKALCILFSLFQLYTASFGAFPTQIQRAAHLGFALCLAYLLYPSSVKKPRDSMTASDIALAVLASWACIYVIVNYEAIMFAAGRSTIWDMLHGALIILLVLEASRRVVGLPISLVAIFFLIYAKAGPYIPGILGHKGFTWRRILHHLYLTTEGILGVPIGVSTEFVFLFILFGAFLHKTGLGKFFIDLALALTGSQIGGPAKVAVIASGFFGTISGSSVANTVTTGTFTIPLMKSIGYRPAFAGAVESAASTGGQIMPPIMGAAAFIMSQFIGISYIEIAKAAVLPALLYYLAVGFMVHMEAKRMNLRGIPKEKLPNAKKTLLSGGHLLIPIVVMVYMLMEGYTPSKSAVYSIGMTLVVAMLRSSFDLIAQIAAEGQWRRRVKDFLKEWGNTIIDALESGARSSLSVAVACACTGIVIGIVTLSGVGLKIANAIVALSGGYLFTTLVLTMIASIILGMGLPTTAKYIILATMAAPAIERFQIDGVHIPMLAAHLFIMYFGIFADLTPPVALVAYAAAGIAKADPNETGFTGLRLALAGFIIPYIFVYSPGLLLINTDWRQLILIVFSAVIGICSLGFAAVGFWKRKLHIMERLLLFVSAIALIFPGLLTDITGVILLGVTYLTQKKWPDFS
ncbi:MAG: TRAP transporter permease [Synergistaceae bacterium]|jgi:TRAP transporter 4TM/12TM fusion protein|nr:TRAP transporter permease [Synergistaceae bacterium]